MANRRRRFRSQPRLDKGVTREPLPACVLHEIYDEVDALAIQHGVSRSWVIATILADAFGIKSQVSYVQKAQSRKVG